MRYATLLSMLLLWMSSLNASAKPINREEAVRIAERFVKQNGYTQYKPSAKEAKHLTHEFIEPKSAAVALRFRHNTLEPCAYAYGKTGRGGKLGWTVVFRYAANGRYGKDTADGRAVSMNRDGSAIRMDHSDAILKAFTPLNQ